MISELIQFDGGLSTKIAPHIIGRNQGLICSNVDLEIGTLKPKGALQFVDNVNGKHVYSFSDTIISSQDPLDDRFYDTYAGRLYWTDDSFAGVNGLRRYDGTNEGVDATAPDAYNQSSAPVTAVATNDYGQLTAGADYSYALTVVDTDGVESAPVFLTTVTLTSSQNSIKIQVDSTLVGTHLPAGHTVNIYRQGGDNPTYNLVMENMSPSHPDVVVDGSNIYWLDITADINVSRIELTTYEHTSPPDNLDMLVENSGTFWGAVGSRVYFSQTGSPEYWGLLDYIKLDKDCTGLGKFADTVVAFTRTSAYLISGYNRDNISVDRLPFDQGCINKHSVVNIDSYLLWTSLNGVCLFDGSNIQVLTKNLLSWDEFGRVGNFTYGDFDGTTKKWTSSLGFDVQYAVGFKDKYYGLFNGGVLVVDVANGMKVSTIDTPDAVALSINEDDGVLYVVVDAGDGTFDIYADSNSGIPMTAIWKTGRLEEKSTNNKKHYRQVELDGEPISVEVFIDGISKYKAEGKSKFMLPSGCIGRDIQFEIVTTNEIRSMKYQFSEMAR